MFSATSARAPAARASAAVWAVDGGVRVVLGLVLLVRRVPSGGDGDEQQDAGAGEHDPEPPDQPGLLPRLVGGSTFLGLGERGALVEELALGRC